MERIVKNKQKKEMEKKKGMDVNRITEDTRSL